MAMGRSYCIRISGNPDPALLTNAPGRMRTAASPASGWPPSSFLAGTADNNG